MKYLLVFSFLILFTNNLSAQDDLRKTAEVYLKVTEAKDAKRVMDFMYPGFFQLYPREMMTKVIEDSFNDPAFEILLSDSKILSMTPPKTADTVTYSVVRYSFVMTLRYLESEGNPLPDKETVDMAFGVFKQIYGEDQVSYIPEEMKFRMTASKKMLLLKTPGLAAWKVLGVEENLKPVMTKIIPEKILEDL